MNRIAIIGAGECGTRAAMQQHLVAAGVSIQTGAKAQPPDAHNILMADETQLHFDAVIAGIGAAPNVGLADLTANLKALLRAA